MQNRDHIAPLAASTTTWSAPLTGSRVNSTPDTSAGTSGWISTATGTASPVVAAPESIARR